MFTTSEQEKELTVNRKLAQLGRRVIVGKVFERKRREHERRILNAVKCMHGDELLETLRALENEYMNTPTEAEIQAEIDKLA